MLAVLEDALHTVLGARAGRCSEAGLRDELRWFMSEDRSHPFAFEVICDVLDLDASWLRRRLRENTRRDRFYRSDRVQYRTAALLRPRSRPRYMSA